MGRVSKQGKTTKKNYKKQVQNKNKKQTDKHKKPKKFEKNSQNKKKHSTTKKNKSNKQTAFIQCENCFYVILTNALLCVFFFVKKAKK